MASHPLIEIRQGRLAKAVALRDKGVNPYPSKSGRTHYARSITDSFAEHDGQTVHVAGRLMAMRKQGALCFARLQDQSGPIQLFLRRQLVRPTDGREGVLGYEDLSLLDLGDVVEASGKVVKTQRGEISVLVETLRLLSKSLRPLPDQWFGLKDREQILRKRYLDVILNQPSQARFERISQMVSAIRGFLNQRGFLEFNTPVIQPQYGGGTAKPFKTHVNALGCEMYLAISHELYLKRLIAAGYDKVYTIGRYFRNEGIDRSHHPEFSMVETMTAYENYEYNMDLIEDMFRHVAESVFGRSTFQVAGHSIDFSKPWKRMAMADAVLAETGIDFRLCASPDEATKRLAELGIHDAAPSVGEALVKAFEIKVEPRLIEPTLIHGHPVEISPLAKPMAEDPRFAERFEIFIAGMECGDNWSEQNDPERLLETWRRAYRPEERDSGEFHALDFDFIEALEYGLPPTTGIGPGIERMAMIFTEQENIDDVIFFPLMRPSVSPVNASLYGVHERAARPVDDPVLTFDEFNELCAAQCLRPQSDRVELRLVVQLWKGPEPTAAARLSGQVELEGFLPNSIVRLAGYQRSSEGLELEKERQLFRQHIESGLLKRLRETFPNCQFKVADSHEAA